ncbi:hypothetical protein ABBQ32_002559 [Trebouxia sp. C0010 RCD-2024]
MSAHACMLSSSVLSPPARLSTAKRQNQCRHMQPVRANYPLGSGFSATDALQQAARQFAQFRKQQQRAASQQPTQHRGDSVRTEAFQGRPFPWNFDAEQVNKFMKEVDRSFGGDGSGVPSADTMRDAATYLYFPADLRESSAEYKYFVDLPGVPKSDIKVQVDKECRLIVSGERKKEEMDVSWRQQKQERRFGAFQRQG